jgi:hypothetical protein
MCLMIASLVGVRLRYLPLMASRKPQVVVPGCQMSFAPRAVSCVGPCDIAYAQS